MNNKKSQDLISGPIVRTLLWLAVPIVFANILQTLYQLIDTFWVGRLGAEAIAAVSLSFPVIFFLMSLGGGASIAGTILVAQYFGKGERDKVNYISAQTFLLMTILAVTFSLIGYWLAPVLMRLMGPESVAVLEGAISYLRISFTGMVFLFTSFVFQSLLRGVGEVRLPLYVVSISVILNFFLDPLFIFGWGPVPALGVAGAAMATVFTEGLSAAVGLYILSRGRHKIKLHRQDFHWDYKQVKQLIRLGAPASVEQSLRSLSMIIMVTLVAGFGTVVLAAYGLGVRILVFVIIPAVGFSIACSTLVGQNMGAGQVTRARDTSIKGAWLGFFILTAIGALFFIFARELAAAFVPGETEVINISVEFLRIMAFSFGLIGVQMVLGGTLRGAGDTYGAMKLTMVSLTVLVILTIILSKYTPLGYQGIFWAYPISNLVGAALFIIIFKKGKWQKRQLIPGERTIGRIEEEAMIDEGLGT